jgi:phage terminase small subunit
MVQELNYGYIMDITSKMDIAKVRLGCVAWRQLIKPRTKARKASRYQVHGRRSRRLRNPKPRVKKKACKVKGDRVENSYGTSRITT